MSRDLNFSQELILFIDSTQNLCKISDLLRFSIRNSNRIIKFEGDFIKENPQSCDTISFVPTNKLLGCDGFNEIKHRTTIKIGRFVNKFFKKEVIKEFQITDQDIEIFVNIFKSYFSTDSNNFKIVEGEEIKKWYLQDNYFTPNGCRYGTLWNSCMRYREKNRYMEIYAKNPDKIKMLVLFGEDGKVKTRALLWESCQDRDGNTHKVMDRIYSIYDHDMIFFKNWALKNGYIHKYEQSARSENIFVTPQNPDPIRIDLTVKLDNHICDYYPYIDSFKFYSRKLGTLSNSEYFSYKYILVQNDGGLVPKEEEEPEYDDQSVDW